MFVMDMIEMPMDTAPMVIVAESGQGKNNVDQKERSIGVCYVVGKRAEENLKDQVPVVPWSDASRYFKYFEQRNINLPYGTGGHQDEVSSKVLRQPAHGALVETEWHNGDIHYFYQADKGYYGKDKAVILGEVNGHRVKIHAYYHVVKTRTFNMDEVCAETGLIWKISQHLDG